MFELETQKFPGLFIAVEAIDGAGTSTLAKGLAAAMIARGLKTFDTKEPTDNLIGGLIRGFLTHEWKPSPRTRQQLFVADRSHHLDRVILPSLAKGVHVVTDRYIWSTFAFGMVDLELLELEHYNDAYPYPDLTFLIDVDIETTQERMKDRDSLQLFEGAKTQSSVRENYLTLLTRYSGRITLLDGKLSPEELVAQALQAVLAHPLVKEGYRIHKSAPLYMPNVGEDKSKTRHGWDVEGPKD